MNTSMYLQVLGAVSLLVTAAVLARGTGRKVSSELWRETAEAEEARRRQLEERVAEQEARIVELQREVSVLRTLVSGSQAIEALSEHIDTRFDMLENAMRSR